VTIRRFGKADFIDLTAFWVGPVGEKASSPFGDLYLESDKTPKISTDFKPFSTNGPINLDLWNYF
jgi:hypothetical protein